MFLFRYTGELILRVAYGIDVVNSDDPFILAVERGVRALSVAARPGAFLVDSLPALRWVPSWMPGAGFKCWAEQANELVSAMRDAPLVFVENALVRR